MKKLFIAISMSIAVLSITASDLTAQYGPMHPRGVQKHKSYGHSKKRMHKANPHLLREQRKMEARIARYKHNAFRDGYLSSREKRELRKMKAQLHRLYAMNYQPKHHPYYRPR